ncbi:MAG: hypothetical protein ACLPX9_12655 [Rhodomicrobium sp.]
MIATIIGESDWELIIEIMGTKLWQRKRPACAPNPVRQATGSLR